MTNNDENAAKIRQAIELVKAGKKSEAKRLLEEVLKDEPENVTAMIEYAKLHPLEKGISILEDVLLIDPFNQRAEKLLKSAHETIAKRTASPSPAVKPPEPPKADKKPVPPQSLPTGEDISARIKQAGKQTADAVDKALKSERARSIQSGLRHSWDDLKRGYPSWRGYLKNPLVLGCGALVFLVLLVGLSNLLSRPTTIPQVNNILGGKVVEADGITPVFNGRVILVGEREENFFTVFTRSDGAYFLTNLPVDVYTIEVIADGYESQSLSNIAFQADSQLLNQNFILGTTTHIEGRVTESDGVTPIAEVGILVFNSEEILGTGLTTSDGLYRVEDLPSTGTYLVRAIKDGYEFPIIRVSADTLGFVDFAAFGGILEGTIVEEGQSTPIVSAKVLAQLTIPFDDSSVPENPFFIVETDNSGHYRFDHLPSGTYILQVSAPGRGTDFQSVTLPQAQQSIIVNVSLTVPGRLTGEVTSVEGNTPIAGAQVEVLDDENNVIILSKEIITDQNGVYSIDELKTGIYNVAVQVNESTLFVQRDVQVVSGETSTLNFAISSAHTLNLSGSVSSENDGTPIENALVVYIADTVVGRNITDAQGVYTIYGLPVGTYTLLAIAPGFVSQVIENVEVTGDVTYGFRLEHE